MADLEKVIKALECCQMVYECKPYEKCPYSNGLECGDCDINRLHYDAITLLKEQEAAYQGAEDLLRQKTILFEDAIKRLKEQAERIEALESLRRIEQEGR